METNKVIIYDHKYGWGIIAETTKIRGEFKVIGISGWDIHSLNRATLIVPHMPHHDDFSIKEEMIITPDIVTHGITGHFIHKLENVSQLKRKPESVGVFTTLGLNSRNPYCLGKDRIEWYGTVLENIPGGNNTHYIILELTARAPWIFDDSKYLDSRSYSKDVELLNNNNKSIKLVMCITLSDIKIDSTVLMEVKSFNNSLLPSPIMPVDGKAMSLIETKNIISKAIDSLKTIGFYTNDELAIMFKEQLNKKGIKHD